MTTELGLLACCAVLGLVHIALAATFSVSRRGVGWAVGARDEARPPLGGIGGRLDRARANFLETFPLFAAAVLVAHALQVHNSLTLLGAQLYFWGRLAYVPAYAAGIPWVRSLIWGVAVAGIVLVLVGLR